MKVLNDTCNDLTLVGSQTHRSLQKAFKMDISTFETSLTDNRLLRRDHFLLLNHGQRFLSSNILSHLS